MARGREEVVVDRRTPDMDVVVREGIGERFSLDPMRVYPPQSVQVAVISFHWGDEPTEPVFFIRPPRFQPRDPGTACPFLPRTSTIHE